MDIKNVPEHSFIDKWSWMMDYCLKIDGLQVIRIFGGKRKMLILKRVQNYAELD